MTNEVKRKEDYDKSSRSVIELGYIRATTVITIRCNWSNPEQISKNFPSTDHSLKFGSVKKESLVIAGQNTAVNMFLSIARIVRHA